MLILIGIILLLFSFTLVKVERSKARSDNYYQTYKGTTDYHGQASTIWTAGDPGMEAREPIEVIAGEATVSNISRKSNLHTFEVDAKMLVKVLNNTVYFPGWRVEVDGRKVPIEFQDINHRGLITFAVPQGSHKVELKFGESPIRLFSDIISAITFIFIMGIWVFRNKLNYILTRV